MEVVVSDAATDFVKDHGGVVYVRSHVHRCCRGPLTLLDVTTEAPTDAGDFVVIQSGKIVIKYRGDSVDQPHVLSIEEHGIVRRHLSAYWDGCVYKP
jgi:hypothetical protein